MGEIKIVDIRLVPWWKFWKMDNLEVVIEDDRDNRKTVTVYESLPILGGLLKEYIAKKYCTGDQFWKPPSKKKEKKPKLSRKEKKQRMLMEAMAVIGESFDCVTVLSKAAED